jgi:tetratricopeptide (TPR) repeat protein
MLRANKYAAVLPVFCTLGLLLIASARADNFENWTNDCKGNPGAAVIIACTQAIDSGRLQGDELAHLLRYRAESDIYEKQFDRAIADSNRAIAITPNYDDAIYFRARAYDESGRIDDAILDYDHLIALHPNSDIFYEGRAMANADGKRYDRALVDFDHALLLAPMPKTFLERAMTTFAMGRYDLAVNAFSTEAERHPQNAFSFVVRGAAYLVWTNGPPDRLSLARKDFDRAIALRPDYAFAYTKRAALEKMLGNHSAEAADLAKERALDSNGGKKDENGGVTP